MMCRIIFAIMVAFCLMAGSAAQADEPSASSVVEVLHDSLLAMMKDADALGFDGRSQHMEPVVAKSFDLPMIAVLASGNNWKSFDEAQRGQLIGALERLSVATYAGRFNGYSGESFRTISEGPAEQGMVFVNTELIKGDSDTIALKYLLRPTKVGWRIIDVYFLGFMSELGMRRSEYASVFKNEGYDGLLAAINKKATDYKAGLLR
jgi:phospholipid transport system substrate-binding protein